MACAVKRQGARTALQQENLMQAAVTMRCKLPIVQARALFDGFNVNDVRQIRIVTKQGIVEDCVLWTGHVRKVQVFARGVHSNTRVGMAV